MLDLSFLRLLEFFDGATDFDFLIRPSSSAKSISRFLTSIIHQQLF